MSIAQNLVQIHASLPYGVKLVAVSKFQPIEAIMEAYDVKQRVFGESRAQELLEKVKVLPPNIEWHFIGHLQTNKVRDILPHVHLIHSVDSLKLLQVINDEAKRIDRFVRVLLEIQIAQEDTKSGFTPAECRLLLKENPLSDFPYVRICGLMGMATNTDNEKQIRNEFRILSEFFTEMQEKFFKRNKDFKELSMGMTYDYPIAIAEGSTMVRIGSGIFGERV